MTKYILRHSVGFNEFIIEIGRFVTKNIFFLLYTYIYIYIVTLISSVKNHHIDRCQFYIIVGQLVQFRHGSPAALIFG